MLFAFQEYQRCFQRTKQKLEESPNDRKFDFSEMYIFGKFDALERRLQKILDMFETIRVYSALEKSKIEGLEPMIGKYQVVVINCFASYFLLTGLLDFNTSFFNFISPPLACSIVRFISVAKKRLRSYKELLGLSRYVVVSSGGTTSIFSVTTKRRYDEVKFTPV